MKPTLDRSLTAEAMKCATELNCAVLMLGHGQYALLDIEDFHTQSQWAWTRGKRGYAVRLQYRGTQQTAALLYLHREIMGNTKGIKYDHVNRNRLDCRRGNLRVATTKQNAGNTGKRTQLNGSTSKFKGVSFDRNKQRWLAQVRANGKMVFLGRFREELAAAAKYNSWASKHFGEFAYLNPL